MHQKLAEVKMSGRMSWVTAAKRSYAGVAAPERQARRREALLEAALDVLAEEGISVVTKKSVCVRAGLNDRYFYENFADRNALLEALAADLTSAGLTAVIAATLDAAAETAARVHAAAEAAIGFMVADPRRGQMLLASHTDAVLQQARLVSTRAIASSMAAMTCELLGEGAPNQLDIDLTAFTLASGTMELVGAWLRGDFSTSREHLTHLVAALLLAATQVSTTISEATR